MPTKRQRSRDNNPLAKQHFNKVVRRNRQLKESLRSVFGVTSEPCSRLKLRFTYAVHAVGSMGRSSAPLWIGPKR